MRVPPHALTPFSRRARTGLRKGTESTSTSLSRTPTKGAFFCECPSVVVCSLAGSIARNHAKRTSGRRPLAPPPTVAESGNHDACRPATNRSNPHSYRARAAQRRQQLSFAATSPSTLTRTAMLHVLTAQLKGTTNRLNARVAAKNVHGCTPFMPCRTEAVCLRCPGPERADFSARLDRGLEAVNPRGVCGTARIVQVALSFR